MRSDVIRATRRLLSEHEKQQRATLGDPDMHKESVIANDALVAVFAAFEEERSDAGGYQVDEVVFEHILAAWLRGITPAQLIKQELQQIAEHGCDERMTRSAAHYLMLNPAPTYLFTQEGIEFYEHPEHGDEAPMLALMPNGRLIDSGLYDRPDESDIANLIEYEGGSQ